MLAHKLTFGRQSISTSSARPSDPGANSTFRGIGVSRRPAPGTRSSFASRSPGSPNCTAPDTRCRTGPREWGGGHVGSRTDRALPGTGRARRAAAGAGFRRHPPRRVDPARRGHRRAASTAPSGNPRRRDLGPGLLRTGGRLRPCQPSHVGSAYRRLLRRQRPEAVGQRRYACRLVPAARPHRPGCAQAQRHFVLPARHDHARRRGAAHPQRHRRLALLRDLPQRRVDSRREPRRRGERRMASGAGDAGRRARPDDAGARRAPGQRGLPMAGAGAARSTTRSWPTGWRSSKPRSPACAGCAGRWWRTTRPERQAPPTRRSSSCTTASFCSA